MKKNIALLLITAMLAGTLTACGSKQEAPAASESETTVPEAQETPADKDEEESTEEPIVIRIGHAQNEEGDWQKGLEVFKEQVETLSEGEMKVEIYANEVLGAEVDNITAIQQGTCEGVLSGDTMSNWTPYAALVAMPYAVNSLDDLITIASSEEVGGVIEQQIVENVKLHPIGFFIRSARNLTTNKKVESMDDLKGMKVRVPNNNLHLAMWNAFGASATPLAWSETFSALQNGTVDAQENPYANIISANIPEVQKYLIKTEHVYSWIYVLIGEEFWQSLTEEQQEIINTAAEEMEKFQWDYLKDMVAEQEATLQDQIEFVEVDKAPFIEVAKRVLEEQLEPEIYDLYLKMIDMNK
ncbi:MAG: TRAP transporter substrate-binding protein [Lachnospiraceae bacterium]|nr:TRAP transporter substrate-binding protein [Lachnospiraceae bacterium]